MRQPRPHGKPTSVSWPRSLGSSSRADARATPVARPAPIEGPAPGVAALFEGVSEDRGHAVLDLGPATDQSLRAYGRFARWICFADLLGEAWWPHDVGSAAGLQLPQLDRTYDLVFAWDILDRLLPDDRPHLVQWLADITAPGAHIHVVVRASEDAITYPLRFTLVDIGHIRYEPTGTAPLPVSRLLPAEVAKVLMPLRVVRAFTLRNGLREYVVLRP